MLRDLIRKWWRLELFLVGADGRPVPAGGGPPGPGDGRPLPRDNDFCRLSQHAPLGGRRCGEALKVVLDRLQDAGRPGALVVHECHLGFDVMASPLWLAGRLCGYVAVSGLIHEPMTAFGESQLLRKVREVAPAAGSGTDLERALRRVPFLSQGETEQLADLLALCASEIQAYKERQPHG